MNQFPYCLSFLIYIYIFFKNLRREVSAHVHSLLAAEPDPTIFDCLCTPVEQFLRQQHALFVCSEEFLDAFNKVDDSFSKLSKSTNITQATARKSKKVLHQPMLTAEMLLKTQYERENAFGERFLFLGILVYLCLKLWSMRKHAFLIIMESSYLLNESIFE